MFKRPAPAQEMNEVQVVLGMNDDTFAQWYAEERAKLRALKLVRLVLQNPSQYVANAAFLAGQRVRNQREKDRIFSDEPL